jgi:hypothetical protein
LRALETHRPELASELFDGRGDDLLDMSLTFSGQEPMINRYKSGGEFMPHQDNFTLTLLVPLSSPHQDREEGFDGEGSFDGGGTAFWSETVLGGGYMGVEPSLVLRPSAGTGLFWRGHVMHAGLPVTEGVRHVFVASFNLCPPPPRPSKEEPTSHQEQRAAPAIVVQSRESSLVQPAEATASAELECGVEWGGERTEGGRGEAGAPDKDDDEDDDEDEVVPFAGMLATGQICPLVRTPRATLRLALDLARVTASDSVLDMGCGAGRLLELAAHRGARAIGVDVNPFCLRRSRERVARTGLGALIKVLDFDLTRIDEHPCYAEATVVYVYLFPKAVAQLESQLRRAVADGKRVVVYCTTGATDTPGNRIGDLPVAGEAHLGMLRLYALDSGPVRC